MYGWMNGANSDMADFNPEDGYSEHDLENFQFFTFHFSLFHFFDFQFFIFFIFFFEIGFSNHGALARAPEREWPHLKQLNNWGWTLRYTQSLFKASML